MPVDTTTEESRYTASQRRINLIWETTQAIIAVAVVAANVWAAFALPAQNGLLANAFFLVIGFYFGRTNHARAGGMVGRS
jgi:hypothetical protein